MSTDRSVPDSIPILYRSGLPERPRRIAQLPLNERGYPIPWFVAYVNGKPDFRVVEAQRRVEAVVDKRCWICGEKIGVHKAFAIGPMCAVNRVSAEPPSHWECAEYAARACPFLTLPKMVRREDGLPEHDREMQPGIMLTRNPGVTLLWETTRFRTMPDGKGSWIIHFGDPIRVQWYAEGRLATRPEVLESIESGMPLLVELAQQDGPDALQLLARMRAGVDALLPEEVLL